MLFYITRKNNPDDLQNDITSFQANIICYSHTNIKMQDIKMHSLSDNKEQDNQADWNRKQKHTIHHYI